MSFPTFSPLCFTSTTNSSIISEDVLVFELKMASCFAGASLVAQRLKRLPGMRETQVRSLGWEDPLEKKWQPTPVLLPGESHGGRSLVGYNPWGHKESDTTERLHFLSFLLCTSNASCSHLIETFAIICSCLHLPHESLSNLGGRYMLYTFKKLSQLLAHECRQVGFLIEIITLTPVQTEVLAQGF